MVDEPANEVREPATKRAIVFVDGQNLFHAAREVFGYIVPNYDVQALASRVCTNQGWTLTQTRFYTGVHAAGENPFWESFWTAKLAAMGRQGVHVFSRALRYREKTVDLPDGTQFSFRTAQEKGIDVRLAIDLIRLALAGNYDVALIFSQDEDLSEAADEIRAVARERGRWLKVASAFPYDVKISRRRGINKTDWIRIDRATYDACLDPRDYRPKHERSEAPRVPPASTTPRRGTG